MLNVWAVYSIIGLALAFDFVNGFHDAANSIATVVSTRVLSPRWAVSWAAFFNFIAFLFFGLNVANTIGKGVVDPTSVTVPVITAALIGALVWNLITWYYGIPSSSSHALVGGLAGAAIQHVGVGVVVVPGIAKITIFIFLAPLIGLIVGFVLMVATYWIFHRSTPARVGKLFRSLQLCSAAAYSLGHGGNDAQKTMGVILVLLIAGHMVDAKSNIPLWVVLACHTAMGLGTMAGGWRIVKTMGQKICKLQPVQGFCAESGGAFMLYFATWAGIPVSTTHVITGAIVGVGSTRGIRAVKWGIARRVVWAWILTIPCSAVLAMITQAIFDLVGWR
jgi:inorganic phosphate transporter, PiT family